MTREEAFSILDIPAHADRARIRQAYSEKSRSCHVETHPEEFNRLHRAYKIALSHARRTASAEPGPARGIPLHHTDDTEQTAAGTGQPSPPEPHGGLLDAPVHKALHNGLPDASVHDDLLDALVHDSFSIDQCLDITQLIYHKYRYDESVLADAAFDRVITKKGIAWQDAPADERIFCSIPWKIWKAQEWDAIICHPEFLRQQYTSAFLDELCYFLHEESLAAPEGIGRNLFYSLCISYDFFHDGMQAVDIRLQEIEYFLRSHPKRQIYIFDLYNKPSLQKAREFVLFCRKAISLSDEMEVWEFLNTAEETLLPEKEFIFQNLELLPGGLFSKGIARLRELQEMQLKCANAFIDTVFPYSSLPLFNRLQQYRQQYLKCNNWRELVCRPAFLQTIKSYIFPQNSTSDADKGNSSPSVRFVPYEIWRQLRIWFNGASPFQTKATVWLKTSFYFPEYEKRYQKERFWKATRAKESFFEEILPVPGPDHEKRKLLRSIKKGTVVDAARMQSALLAPVLTDQKIRIPFLARLTYTMVHFRFLQYTSSNGLPGGTFCFLKKEVILYQQNDNLVCRLSHEAFYDILSQYFDLIVYSRNPSADSTKTYSQEFLDNTCRNLYCYECYAHSDLYSRPKTFADVNV